MRIRMSESEFTDLASKVRRQRSNIHDVIRSANSAKDSVSPDWQSNAFENFVTVWNTHKGTLQQIADQLDRWDAELKKHAGVAQVVNRPFKV